MTNNVEKIRPIEEIPPLNLPYSFPLSPPVSLADSTLTKSHSLIPPYTPSKPTLDPPKSPFWNTAQAILRVEDTANRYGACKQQQMERHFKELDELHLKEAAFIEEYYQAAKTVGFWGLLEDIGNTVMSSVSLFYGFSAVSSGGTLVGGALITSGILSISNLLFKHTEMWDFVSEQFASGNKELKGTIKNYLPSAVGLTAATLGIYGSYQAWNLAYAHGMDKAKMIFDTVGNIANGFVSFTKGRSDAHLTSTRSELSWLQSIGDLLRIDLQSMVEELKEFMQKQTETKQLASQLIEEANQALQVVLQPV